VAGLLGAQPGEIVFTSGATEANNWVIKGLPFERPHIVTTRVEHPSILNPCRYLELKGRAEVTYLEVDEQGLVAAAQVQAALRPETRLVTVKHGNNETGAVLPVAEIARAVRTSSATVRVHTDAAQSLGKLPVDVHELQVDFLTVAGHKVYAPKGIGALFLRSGCELEPWLHGAGHEHGLRSGTENVALIVGLGAACALAARKLGEEGPRLRGLRDDLERELLERTAGQVVRNGPAEPRLPNTLSLNFMGVAGADLLARCPGLAASTGPACHDGQVRLSHVLEVMRVAPALGRGAVRLTLGRSTTQAQVQQAADELVRAYLALAPVPPGVA
jgi:cysteine desulfurase